MIETSLRSGLVVRLMAAIVMLLVLDSIACYYTAAHFANLVYDRWLIDSNRSLSKAVKVVDRRVEFDLPHVARDVFEFDEVDKTYFQISSRKQGFIAGVAALPQLIESSENGLRLVDARVDNQHVRLVATNISLADSDDVVTVEVAETLNKRAQLRTEILLAMSAPQVGLLIVALALAWFGIARGLKPLTDLAAQIEARGHDNLTPVPEANLPKEARTLVSKINDLLVRLERAMVAQKRFVADAAHQLRTPLAAILLYTERAQRVADGDQGQLALLGLHSAAERAARLSQQLLTLARAEPEAAAAIELKPVNLSELARAIGEEWIARALAQEIDFGLVVPDFVIIVNGNAGLLGELLSNLVDNALRYSGRGSRVTVAVEARPTPRLIVEDDGPGIPIDERTKIFERFYRAGGEASSGCGLGLAIVAEIAKLHRAAVQVESGNEQHGVRFIVKFSN